MTTEFEPRGGPVSAGPQRPAGDRRSPFPVFGLLAALTVAIIVAIAVTNLGHDAPPVAGGGASTVTTGTAPPAPAAPKAGR